MIHPAEIRAAARALCKFHGDNPDAIGPAPNDEDIAVQGHAFPRWHDWAGAAEAALKAAEDARSKLWLLAKSQ